MCHVIDMLVKKNTSGASESGYQKNIRKICHVTGMLGKEPLHLECQ